MLLFLSCYSFVVFGKPVKSAASEEAARIWEEKFYRQPILSLDDPRILVRMFLLSPYGKKVLPPRNMALADVVITKFGTYAVRESIPEKALLERAVQLKNAALSPGEAKQVKDLTVRIDKKFRWTHPDAGKFSFLIKDDAVNLHHTIEEADTMEEALREIARQNGLVCNYRSSDALPAEDLRLILAYQIPVVLEEKTTGKWLVVFGSWQKDGIDYVFLNDPSNTTVMEGAPKGSVRDNECMRSDVIKICVTIKKTVNIPKDIISDVKIQLPKLGFFVATYHPQNYRAHVMTNWRTSAEAWDLDLSKLLNLKLATSSLPAQPASDASEEVLWNYYFRDVRTSGDPVCSAMTPLLLLRLNSGTIFQSNLISVLAQQDKSPWVYTLIPNKIWLYSRTLLNNDLLIPTQPELDAITALGIEQEKIFQRHFEAFTGNKYNMLSEKEFSEDRLPSSYDPAKTAEWIFSLTGSADTPKDALYNYAANTGKRAALEGGKIASWELYQRAILQQIPILLHNPKSGDWKIAFGYLCHGGRKLLLTVTAKPWTEDVQSRKITPGVPLPKGVQFEPFDESAYIPYFIHELEPDVASVTKPIRKIFKDNPNVVTKP